MRILAFSPFDLSTASGNSITLRRLAVALASRGHVLEVVVPTPAWTAAEARKAVADFRPDVVHFYHAYKSGRLLPALALPASVVTVAGTDLNDDFADPGRRGAVEEALARAGRIVTYNPSLALRLRAAFPASNGKVTVLPKGVTLGDAPFDLRSAAALGRGDFVFFHPGGIRPVKNSLFAIDALASHAGRSPRLRLVFAGPLLDEAYGATFRRRVAAASWTRHLEGIPFEAMGAAYRASDVVINTSLSEGISNALMEAMAAARAVLAADIPGNRDLIQDGVTGLLYAGAEAFAARASGLMEDPELRGRLGAAARDHAARHFSTDAEAEALLEVYRALRGAK